MLELKQLLEKLGKQDSYREKVVEDFIGIPIKVRTKSEYCDIIKLFQYLTDDRIRWSFDKAVNTDDSLIDYYKELNISCLELSDIGDDKNIFGCRWILVYAGTGWVESNRNIVYTWNEMILFLIYRTTVWIINEGLEYRALGNELQRLEELYYVSEDEAPELRKLYTRMLKRDEVKEFKKRMKKMPDQFLRAVIKEPGIATDLDIQGQVIEEFGTLIGTWILESEGNINPEDLRIKGPLRTGEILEYVVKRFFNSNYI